MGFTIPNAIAAGGSQADDNQAEPDSVDFAILAAGISGDGVVSGCAVTAQGSPNMTLAVAAGVVSVGGLLKSVAAGNVTITTADATNPRFDLVVVDNTGAKSVTAGTAAADPVFPAIPANSIVLASVWVPAGDTAISTNQIVDKRLVLAKRLRLLDEAHADAGGASSSSEQTLASLVIPGSLLAAGDVLRFTAIGDALSNGLTTTYTWKFKIGTTTILTSGALSVTTSANRLKWNVALDIHVVSTSSQRVGGDLFFDASGVSTSWARLNGTNSPIGYGTAAEDTSTDKSAILTCQLNQNSANADVVLRGAALTHLPKG